MLSAVKRSLLNIFKEEGFFQTEISPHLDIGEREEELRSLLEVNHSDWFLSSSAHHSTASISDEQTYGTRSFSCSELIALQTMARGDPYGESDTFNPVSIICAENQYISRLDVILRKWDGFHGYGVPRSVNVVGGLNIYISSPEKDPVCFHAGTPEEESRGGVHTISLREGEHITRVSGKSGGIVESLAFETSDKRMVGPYGGNGGDEKHLMKTIENYRKENVGSVPLDSILVGITGREYEIASPHRRGDTKHISITNLRFIFR